MKVYGFPKPEHLSLQRDIDALFSAGSHSTVAYPVRAVWKETEWPGRGPRVKVLVSVSKRKFKHAVDRNRAKRQMREAYRLNKHVLAYNRHAVSGDESVSGDAARDVAHATTANADGALPYAGKKALHIGFIWLANEPQESRFVHKRIVTLLKRINEACSADS